MPAKKTRTPKPAAIAALTQPALKKGEIYVGAIIGATGKGRHVVLLPGDDKKNWKDALAWAKKLGGDLPDRVEQAMLFAGHREEFEETWYWSNTAYARSADYAWIQGFGYGGQSGGRKSDANRCRAVRRVAI